MLPRRTSDRVTLDLLDEDEINRKWEELLRWYGGCKISRLDQVFQEKQPGRNRKILLN